MHSRPIAGGQQRWVPPVVILWRPLITGSLRGRFFWAVPLVGRAELPWFTAWLKRVGDTLENPAPKAFKFSKGASMIPAAKPLIGADEEEAVMRVLRSGMIAQGPEVAAFEEDFSAIVGGRRCVAVNSGTSALHIGMVALGIGPGDEVIVPSFTFAATGNSVALTGATPVFVDIEADSFCIDPVAVEAAITERTAAIMPVHLYGHPAAMDRLRPVAERHGLALIEDAAQAHAASLHGVPVGAAGTVAAFSFYPTKNMTSGEGGMIVTDDPDIERAAVSFETRGWSGATRTRWLDSMSE